MFTILVTKRLNAATNNLANKIGLFNKFPITLTNSYTLCIERTLTPEEQVLKEQETVKGAVGIDIEKKVFVMD
jgi:hypothetical protein